VLCVGDDGTALAGQRAGSLPVPLRVCADLVRL
jgi:hypothetical protein